MPLVFDRAFVPHYGEVVALSPLVSRITAENPGPFTFFGTNSYLIGDRSVMLIDPGPDDPRHHAALAAAIAGRRVEAILLTHTHRDHSSGARTMAQRTSAPILAEGPHRPARPARPDEQARLDASGDTDLVPDRLLRDGDIIAVDGIEIGVVTTPGHAVNHLAFALSAENSLISGDHVMAWSTSIVAPPDGSMADYMASLERLQHRSETIYYPGHGGRVTDVQPYLAGLRAHRKAREQAILDRLEGSGTSIAELVEAIYVDTNRSLHGAAALSVLAHLEDLAGRGLVHTDGAAGLAARYRRA